jgi:hypothetical protein
MVRIHVEDGLKDRDGFLCGGKILIVPWGAIEKRKRVEDRSFLIVRKSLVQFLAFLSVGGGPLFMADLVIVAVKRHQRSDIRRLARSF